MSALLKDITKLCDEALASGRSAFTYALCIRVNLAYGETGWALVAVVIDIATNERLGDAAAGLPVLCRLIEERLGERLHFGKPERLRVPSEPGPTWLVRSSGGPKPGATMDVDLEACGRIVRYAKRDGKGTVTTNGWQLRLYKASGRWLLEVTDEVKLETWEDLSKRHYQLGQLSETISHLLRAPVEVRKTGADRRSESL